MCVICHFKPTFNVSFEKLSNAVLNNPHGWGLITIDRGKVEVRKGCPENGNDPEELYKIIQDGRDVERFLHVRFNTVGKTSLENCHPFELIGKEKGKPKVYFMHNGTIYKYRPGAGSDHSDSYNYANTFIGPLIRHFKGERFDHDYHDPFFQTLLGDTFDSTNRGLLVSDKFEPLYLGKWELIKDGDDENTFMASNNQYFDKVIISRMPKDTEDKKVYLPPPPVDKQDEAGNKKKELTELKNIELRATEQRKLTVKDFEKLISWGAKDDNLEDLTDEDISYMAFILPNEFSDFAKENPIAVGYFLKFLTTRFCELYDEFGRLDDERIKIVNKHEAATQLIASLKFEINELHKSGTKGVKAA